MLGRRKWSGGIVLTDSSHCIGHCTVLPFVTISISRQRKARAERVRNNNVVDLAGPFMSIGDDVGSGLPV